MILDMEKGEPMWPAAAMRTIYSSRWERLIARIFGKRVEGHDSGYKITAYRLRGRLYITKFERLSE